MCVCALKMLRSKCVHFPLAAHVQCPPHISQTGFFRMDETLPSALLSHSHGDRFRNGSES